jgi:hypothetical protein
MINRTATHLLSLALHPAVRLPLRLSPSFAFSKQSDLERISTSGRDLDDLIPHINKPREADGGIYSVERVIERDQVSEELKERMDKLKKRHELLRVELAQRIDIPFLLCGVNRKTYHEAYGYMPERVMSYYRIHPTTITDYLLKIYKASLYSIVDRNTAYMDEYWEAGLKEKVLKSLEVAREKGYNLKITEDKKFAEEMNESCRIVDAVMVRGLSIDRSENEGPSQYHRYAEDKEFGLITYTPLYLTNDNERFADPEANKTIYKGYEKMLMRLLLLVKTPVRLTVPELPIPEELNTYEHLVVIENEMVAPPHLESRYKL